MIRKLERNELPWNLCRNSQFKLQSMQIIMPEPEIVQRISEDMRKGDLEITSMTRTTDGPDGI